MLEQRKTSFQSYCDGQCVFSMHFIIEMKSHLVNLYLKMEEKTTSDFPQNLVTGLQIILELNMVFVVFVDYADF